MIYLPCCAALYETTQPRGRGCRHRSRYACRRLMSEPHPCVRP